MLALLEFKEKMKNFYSEHVLYLRPVLKFLAVFITMILIKYNVGYLKSLNMWPILLVISLILAFLPWTVIVVAMLAVIVANIYAVSSELAALVLVVMVIMLLFFFKFTPGEGIFLLIIPLAFFLKIPYVVPIAVGLVCTPLSIISVVFGTLIYFMLYVISENNELIGRIVGESTGTASINSIIHMMSSNQEMFITMIAFAITIIVVYSIKRMKINNAWTIAILSGGIVEFVFILVAALILNIDISLVWLIIGTILSLALSYVLQFFVFSVDYSRTEHTQFEDDEYYYYVKAVPKINVTAPEMNVKRINAQRKRKAPVKKRQ